MMETIAVENRAGLAPADFDGLRAQLAVQTSMQRVLAWLGAHAPPLAPVDLVAQDEFSYDLLVPLSQQTYLSYDTS